MPPATTKPGTVPKVVAPVIVSSSYLEGLRKTAGQASLPTNTRVTAAAPRDAKERAAAMKLADERKHALAASRTGEAVVSEILDEEDRRRKLQEGARPILTKIREARVETMTEVQQLNHKVAQARVMDSWKKEAEIKAQRKREEEDSEAMFAEMARRRDVEMLEQAAALARHKREREREASDIIARQLEERAMERELELEAKELEAEQMNNLAIARERALVEKKKHAEEVARIHREELTRFNEAAIKRKAERAAEEKRADTVVLHHLISKAAAERERIVAAEKAKKEKDQAFSRILAEREKVLDRKGEEDEKRARLHEEAVIMKERARAAREGEYKEALMRKVLEERDLQIRLKGQRLEEEKAEEMNALARLHLSDMEQAEKQLHLQQAKAEATLRYKAELENDLSRREKERRSVEAKKSDDRTGMRQEDTRRARALEEARMRKVAELRAEGVTEAALRATRLI